MVHDFDEQLLALATDPGDLAEIEDGARGEADRVGTSDTAALVEIVEPGRTGYAAACRSSSVRVGASRQPTR